ncbi:ATP-dependent DNA ligase [Paenarthrobacter sp. NPDC018779]|uniref:ATP-dependent DNA ligase n=1 Tax=Paenarthrobacter sp. NPDC018779 TaxID=3364375 RepID=UPI0037C62936
MAGKQKERVTVEGHELTLTNLGKIIYPETGTTKAEVLAYYAAVAPFLIPAAANRPVTRKRWVNGVGTAANPGEVFFQKNLESSVPRWIPRATIHHSDHTNVYPMVNNLATLTWMAQIASLEIHVPQWQVDPSGTPLRPDRFVLDLDPGPGAGLPECVEVAKLARSILQDMGMEPVPVTSGSKGIHLYTGLEGTLKSEQVSAFAHELARALEADHPKLVVSDMKKSLRSGKVLVDWSQNSGNKTTIVPYSLRGKPHPTVAAPRTWDELDDPDLGHLEFTEVMDRVSTGEDHFASISGRHLPPHSEENDAGTPAESAGSPKTGGREKVTVEGRLAKYVGMRDPGKTPEPFPASSVSSSGTATASSDQPRPGDPAPPGGIFVIQEHHARRYHLDFRLEHDGVLVSWALPRGVPDTPDRNNLAVHTEDHPMDYANFAGVIPKGEYGGGTVTIWDRGEFTCEKWREGKEVIATLTGEPGGGLGGTKRFALINTGDRWLIHLMKEQPGGRKKAAAPAPDGKAAPDAKPPTAVEPEPMPGYTPMLASAGSTGELSGGDWLYELKWDGIRAIITGTEGRIRLMSRNGNDLTAAYPELTDRNCWPDGDFVADGEIVAFGKGGKPDFGRLQQRMNLVKAADIERAQASVPVQLMLFDLLYHRGADLSRLPFRERREHLSSFVDKLSEGCPLRVSEVLDHDVDDLLAVAAELGLEGVMAKKADSRYTVGRRSRSWIKLKLERSQEVVIGGWRPGAGARSGTFGSLLLGIPDGGKLRYVGRVGSGFSDWQLNDILGKLQPRATKDSPFLDIPREDAAGATWVEPDLVAEVTFGEWTGPGRLRHPVWKGWRPDKSPSDVTLPN